jgi:hypothetical protein
LCRIFSFARIGGKALTVFAKDSIIKKIEALRFLNRRLKMGGSMKNTVTRSVAALLLFAFCLPLFFGCGSGKNGKNNGTYIALTGDSFSDEFIDRFNPLYAETPAEYAAGLLIAPTVMRYEEGKGWVSVLGTISVSKEEGKTVAMIKLDGSIRYSNKRKLTADEYLRVVKMILRTDYHGYFKDFYTYPIEGLVAFRYNCKGLTFADLPDFDSQLTERFEVILGDDLEKAQKAYEAMLSESKIFGLYDGNPLTKSPDGRTFKEVLLQDSKKAPEEGYFTAADVDKVMLADLCALYAQKDREEWMLEPLRIVVREQLEQEFKDTCPCITKCQPVNGVVSGVVKYDSTTVKVIFEKEIEDENRVIEMLNLPMLHSFVDKRSPVVGAGSYVYRGQNSQGKEGSMVMLESESERPLYLCTANPKDVYATVYMGQLSAAAIDGKPDASQVESYGLKTRAYGDRTVIYRADLISEEELDRLAMLFS